MAKTNAEMRRSMVNARAERAIVGGRVNVRGVCPLKRRRRCARALPILRPACVSFTISSSMASPASTSSSSVMRRVMPLRLDAPSRASSGTWTNAARRGIVSARRLDRAPAQIIAEIAAGVARGARIDAGAERRAQQLCGVRAEHLGVGAAGDRALAHAGVIGVRPQHGDGVAGAGLDADMRACGRRGRTSAARAAGALPAAAAIRDRPPCRSPEKYALAIRHR